MRRKRGRKKREESRGKGGRKKSRERKRARGGGVKGGRRYENKERTHSWSGKKK